MILYARFSLFSIRYLQMKKYTAPIAMVISEMIANGPWNESSKSRFSIIFPNGTMNTRPTIDSKVSTPKYAAIDARPVLVLA